MSKGSHRRPTQVDSKVLADNWDRIFKSSKSTTAERPDTDSDATAHRQGTLTTETSTPTDQ